MLGINFWALPLVHVAGAEGLLGAERLVVRDRGLRPPRQTGQPVFLLLLLHHVFSEEHHTL